MWESKYQEAPDVRSLPFQILGFLRIELALLTARRSFSELAPVHQNIEGLILLSKLRDKADRRFVDYSVIRTYLASSCQSLRWSM